MVGNQPIMAKLQLLPIIAALCLALAGVAVAPPPKFMIEGRVYCDTCRAGFETTASRYIEGAKVKLECRQYGTNDLELTAEGVTDSNGIYQIEVVHTHQEEVCEVALAQSPDTGCSEVAEGRDRARILISGHNGIATGTRHANALGFLKAEPLPECGQLLQQYALGVDG